MKKNTAYSLVVFLMAATYLFFGFFTEASMGVVAWGDLQLGFGMAMILGTIAGGSFYFVFTKVSERLWSTGKEMPPFIAGRNFIIASVCLIAASSAYGVKNSYSVGKAQLAEAKAQQEAAEKVSQMAIKAQEDERQRLASLTPEQRADEERQKRDKLEEEKVAAEKTAAKKTALIELQKENAAKAQADHDARNLQLKKAMIGATVLKGAMKNPEAFVLKSLLVMPNGAACYNYRAQNSFNAMLQGHAVLTSDGKMFVDGNDGNSFVRAWNKNCADSIGEEILPMVKDLGILE